MSRLTEPWRSFLVDIDALASSAMDLHCLGGFAVSVHYGLGRPTGDIDVVQVVPNAATSWLAEVSGLGSVLHRRHKIHLQIASVASVPESYEDRLIQITETGLEKIKLFVLDPYDLALSKLSRNLDVDMDDVKHLARAKKLDLEVLESRYRTELRPIIIGPTERHDLTMKLWIEAITEERSSA